MRSRRFAVAVAVAVAGLLGGSATVQAIKGTIAQGPLFAVVLGENEVGPDGRKGAGDPDGRGAFNAIIDGSQICYGLSVKDIGEPTAAHIHRGRPTESGPVVLSLVAPSSGNPGASSDCRPIAPDLVEAIQDHPHQFYVNVHNAAFPGGALRGELFIRRN